MTLEDFYNSGKSKDGSFDDYQNADQDQLNGYLAVMCMYNNLEHIKHLLASPLLEKHADFHANNDEAFRCLQNCDLEIMEYLIFDYGIKSNSNIEDVLQESTNEFAIAVRNMFKLKDCQELDSELSNNVAKAKRNKV